jgi:hypothetical protein
MMSRPVEEEWGQPWSIREVIAGSRLFDSQTAQKRAKETRRQAVAIATTADKMARRVLWSIKTRRSTAPRVLARRAARPLL